MLDMTTYSYFKMPYFFALIEGITGPSHNSQQLLL